MMKTKTAFQLNKVELIHPIFNMFFIGALGAISFNAIPDVFYRNYKENSITILTIILAYVIYNILNISRCVEIKKNEIIDGIFISPIGFVKINKKILLNDIKEIIIHKNSKKFSEIRAVCTNGNFLVIKTIANRIPAQEEMEKIISKINSAKTIM